MNRLSGPLTILLAALILPGAAVLAGAGLAAAHGNPEITVTPNPAPAGSTVTIECKDFEEDEEVSLVLEGVSGDLALGMAMTDAEGDFRVEVSLPDSAGPGSYRVRAQGSDATAIAEFRITPAAGEPPPAVEHEASIGFHRGGPADEVIALSIIIAVLAVAGAALLMARETSLRRRA